MPSTPFLYPQARHRRKQQPPLYSSYASYKPWLKREFVSQCVYCRLPDGLKGDDGFGVDHYRPQSKFPELVTAYTNLFYACNCCNRRKGAFWPTDDQQRVRHFLPNPCDHVMFEHLRYRAARVETRSPAGELAERLLMLNDENSIKYRELVLEVIASLEARGRRLQETIRRIDRRSIQHPEQADQCAAERASTMQDLARIQQHLSQVFGAGSL